MHYQPYVHITKTWIVQVFIEDNIPDENSPHDGYRRELIREIEIASTNEPQVEGMDFT